MKLIVWAFVILDAWLGLRALLSVVGILQTSKYAPATTALFAILMLGFAAGCIYFLRFRDDLKTALLLAIGPWLLGAAVMFVALITGRQP
jgi:hypothetical protein